MNKNQPLDLIGKNEKREIHGWPETGVIRGVLPDGRFVVEVKGNGQQVVITLGPDSEWKVVD